MFFSVLQRFRYFFFLILIVLITVSFHPSIQDASRLAGMESGTILSRYILVVFAALSIICLSPKILQDSKNIRFLAFVFLFIALYYLMTFSFFGRKEMMSDLRSIGICIMAMVIGWQLDLNEKSYKIAVLLFAGITVIVGLLQVTMNIGGFEILDQAHTDAKNTLGVLLSTSAIVFMLYGIRAKKVVWKVLSLSLLVFTIVILLTIRARAAVLTTGIMVLYVLYQLFKGKNFIFYSLFGILLIIIVYLFLPSSIKNFVYDSFVQNHEFDLTSDRTARNIAGIEFLSQHLWFGDLNVNAHLAWIHNYPLNILYKYGLLFSFPILLTYLYILFVLIFNIAKYKVSSFYTIGYFALMIPFIVSMAEPTFPFGPGTGTVINFILFGIAIRKAYHPNTIIVDKSDSNLQ